ncbi:MAG: protein kinase [Myxococcales bacterium]|nr:protein kinase [Myxococcales bacterium]MCB9712425.1 protein kinase [Myxococcales bacterium]
MDASTVVGHERAVVDKLARARRDGIGVDARLRHSVEARLFGDRGPARLGGRYELGERLGAGGCGVVHQAHDPELDRDVAIKLLRPEHVDDLGRRRLAARLQREAKAASHVNHPNVVTIYDVGVDGDVVFVVMERLRGRDLRAWSRAAPRRWPEIRDVFVAAARGLEAVHAAGLVHRDFKPSNVFVTETGRVCLLDFGLSKHAEAGGHDSEAGPQTLSEPELGPLSGTLTRSGDVVGTPLYMAPEQHEGRGAGPSADQFALCASMYEALCGAPAYSAATIAQLHVAKVRGELHPVPAGRAPRWLWAALRRGLQADPSRRWPDLGSLRRALEHAGRRPSIGRVSSAVALSVALGAVATLDRTPRTEPVGEAIERALPPLDPVLAGLARERLERARTLETEGRWSEALTEARGARIGAERAGADEVFAEAALRVARLQTRAQPPARAAEVFEELFFEIVEREQPRVAAQIAADLVFQHGVLLSRPEQALRWAEHARSQLDRLEPGADSIVLEHSTGGALRHAGWLEPARSHLERAVELARHHGDPSTRAKCEIELASTLNALGETEAAYALAREALQTLEREHGPDDPVLVQALQVVSQGAMGREDWSSAADLLGRALALLEAPPGDQPLLRAVTLTRLAGAEARCGRIELARAHAIEALEIVAGSAVEPATAAALSIDVAVALDDLEEHQRIVDVLTTSLHELDDGGPGLGAARVRGHVRLAGALTTLRRTEEAAEHLQAALELLATDEHIDEPTRRQQRLLVAVRQAELGACDAAWPEIRSATAEHVASLTAQQRALLRFHGAQCDPEGSSIAWVREAASEPLPPTPAAQRLSRRIDGWLRRHRG